MDWFLESEEALLQLFNNITRLSELRGGIIGLWALIESSLDQANNYAWLYSQKSISKVVPLSLRYKVQLFEQIHTEVEPLIPLKDQAGIVLAHIRAHLDDRHWMAHGYYLPHKSTADCWLLTKGEFLPDGSFRLLERRFTKDELESIQMDIVRLAVEVERYARLVSEQIREHGMGNGSG